MGALPRRTRNPFLAAYVRSRQNRLRAEGLAGWLPALLGPVVAIALLVPLVRPVFLSFLDLPEELWAQGMAGVLMRAGVVIVGWLSLDVFSAVVRGSDREVLGGLPVDAAAVVRFQVLRVALERWWLLPAAMVLLSPVAFAGAPGLWAAGALALLGSAAMGLAVSAAGHLLAIEIAESERWAGFLDLVRGNNPRPQAAFLYAPGAVLAVSGLAVAGAANGAVAVAAGAPQGWIGLLAPWALVMVAWARVGPLARRAWFRGSAVLAEIDARYAILASPEERLAVYLDWTVRWLPARAQVWALRDLRHGWRGRRTLISVAWLVGLAGFVAGWTLSEVGPQRAMAVAVGGSWLVAALGVLLEQDEPEFLRVWLPQEGGAPQVGRIWALVGWISPCIWPAALSVAMRRGLADAGFVLGAGLLAAAVAIGVAVGCGRLRARGLVIYAPVATVLAAAMVTVMGRLG